MTDREELEKLAARWDTMDAIMMGEPDESEIAALRTFEQCARELREVLEEDANNE